MTHDPTHDARYRDEGRIAQGGMCEVRRVFDQRFGYYAALKRLRPELVDDEGARARFAAEVMLTARMQHPGVVAVYDQGELPDGRPWFTMTEVRGVDFSAVIAEAHAEGPPSEEALRRLVGLLLRACEAVAYAHSQGIIHRDLKPGNLMVGPFGEVLVMDWGIARALDAPDATAGAARDFLAPELELTQAGDVLGTLAYMAPEQARGELDTLGPPADVYALGGVLYHLITGAPADTGPAIQVWRRRLRGSPELFTGEHTGAAPEALERICRRAMQAEPEARYPSASALSEALRAWLDGAERRARALRLLDEAAALQPELDRLRGAIEDKRAQAMAILAPLPPHAPVARKAPAWALEDEAEALEREAALAELRWQRIASSALEQSPELPEAHARLADHYAERLLSAEQQGRQAEVARCEALLAQHDRGRHAALLSGVGAITLITDPPGAEVRLFEFVADQRRLVPVPRGVLGRTPLIEAPLARGSWLLELHLEGHHSVRYPVYLERGGAWDGVRPGGAAPHPIWLPALGELGEAERYIPAGWFVAGGDPMAVDSLPRQRVWVDAFCVDSLPVTNATYLGFLNALLRTQDPESLRPLIPRLRTHGADTFTLQGGVFALNPACSDERPDMPVVGLNWAAAVALAGALPGERRLLHELEWEKAARGCDGRRFPWGEHFEASWACMNGHAPGPPARSAVGRFPHDISPYGVRDIAGNVRDWCGNVWAKELALSPPGLLSAADTMASPDEGGFISCRGGAWSSTPVLCRSATRFADRRSASFATLGVRTGRSVGPRRPRSGG